MINILYVGIGGFFGAILRYAISEKLNKNNNYEVPLGTLLVNIGGSFLLGTAIGIALDKTIFLLVAIGFLGSLTTFSTLNLELTKMRIYNKKKQFYIYLLLTYLLGIVSFTFGYIFVSIN